MGLQEIAPHLILRFGAGLAIAALSFATFLQLGHWRDSVSLLTHTIAAAGESGEAHTLLGYAYQVKGDLEPALAHYARARQLQPNQVVAVNNTAMIYLLQGRWKEAEDIARLAILLDPSSGGAYLNLGDALDKQDRKTEAVEQYTAATRVQPGLLTAYEKLGNAQLLLNHSPEAAAAYEAATRLAPAKAINWANLGVTMSSMGQFKEAQPVLRKAIALDPDSAYARYYLALALHLTGDQPAAIEELKKLVAVHPDNPEGSALLQQLLQESRVPAK